MTWDASYNEDVRIASFTFYKMKNAVNRFERKVRKQKKRKKEKRPQKRGKKARYKWIKGEQNMSRK